MGRVFMAPLDDPFAVARARSRRSPSGTRDRLVDFHAEATSEKVAMGWHLDGRVTAVVGTHTHVQTADERILPGGTAYITDVGMTGPHDGIIGVEREPRSPASSPACPSRFDTATGQSAAARRRHRCGRRHRPRDAPSSASASVSKDELTALARRGARARRGVADR